MMEEERVLHYIPNVGKYEMINELKSWNTPSASFKSNTDRFPGKKESSVYPVCSYLEGPSMSTFGDANEQEAYFFKTDPDRTKGLKTPSSQYPMVDPQTYQDSEERDWSMDKIPYKRRPSSTFISRTPRTFQGCRIRDVRRASTPGPGHYLKNKDVTSFRRAARKARNRLNRSTSSLKSRRKMTHGKREPLGFLSTSKRSVNRKDDCPTPSRYHRSELHTMFRKPKRVPPYGPAYQSLTHGRHSYIEKQHLTKNVRFMKPKDMWRKRSHNRKIVGFGTKQKRFVKKHPFQELYLTKVKNKKSSRVERKLKKRIMSTHYYTKEYGYIPEIWYKPMKYEVSGKVNRK